jgi:hypothetical protein
MNLRQPSPPKKKKKKKKKESNIVEIGQCQNCAAQLT